MIFYSLGKNNNNFMQTTIVFLLTNTGKKTAVEEDVWQAVSFPREENETFRYLRKSWQVEISWQVPLNDVKMFQLIAKSKCFSIFNL